MSGLGPSGIGHRPLDREAHLENGQIDHAASAINNLEAAAGDMASILFPDKTLKAGVEATAGLLLGDVRNPGLEVLKGMGRDVLDIVTGPLFAVKDLTDAAIHGLMLGFAKI